ncbi:hypothetical protein PVK06_037470 [Gossypium arboreum]|uniref:Uncharacterized protein n=1 Tax=Gossypium arboreum TaxID=29729 RepID=A0ABR0MXE8_GOSAR|nr:hypothetical protein PVK06_037470 [Gossypium arboreum]
MIQALTHVIGNDNDNNNPLLVQLHHHNQYQYQSQHQPQGYLTISHVVERVPPPLPPRHSQPTFPNISDDQLLSGGSNGGEAVSRPAFTSQYPTTLSSSSSSTTLTSKLQQEDLGGFLLKNIGGSSPSSDPPKNKRQCYDYYYSRE